jgi:hypothetical protein
MSSKVYKPVLLTNTMKELNIRLIYESTEKDSEICRLYPTMPFEPGYVALINPVIGGTAGVGANSRTSTMRDLLDRLDEEEDIISLDVTVAKSFLGPEARSTTLDAVRRDFERYGKARDIGVRVNDEY